MRVAVEAKVLSENDKLAGTLRAQFRQHKVFCLNLISSPGSGKTALLERTLAALPASARVALLTGDLQTENDARRLARSGFPVRQIITGETCHLDASMVIKALAGWDLEQIDVLYVENVGNLVCPVSYDLGEHAKVVLLSVTEGEDKPLKYPAIFAAAELCIINKVDLLPYVPFRLATAIENVRQVHPGMEVVETSCTEDRGIAAWSAWVERRRRLAMGE
ncbi:MAG: hydrogenase nickel incorporation protein HypB [Polyangia bacterium]